MKESFIENKFVKYVEDDGGKTVKIQQKKGWPDRVVLPPVPMGILWIEFKRPGLVARKIQKHVHEQLKELGHAVAEVDSFEKAVAIYEEYKRIYSSRLHHGVDKVSDFQSSERVVSGTRIGKDDHHLDGVQDSEG